MKAKQQTEQRAGVLPPVNFEALNKIAVDKLFGKRHWAAEWALELCAADPYFAAHMAEQPRGYAHYLCVLRLHLGPPESLEMERRQPPASNLRECARAIRTTGKRKLLKAWFPDCPVEILKAFPELPKTARSEAEYRRLIVAFADARKRKRFFHVKRMSEFDMQLLDMMKDLPERFHPAAFRCRHPRDFEKLCLLVECAKRLGLDIPAREFGAVTKRSKSMRGLWRYLVRHALKLPFPPPPWDGDDNIRPLRSRDEMKAAGKQLGNCIANNATNYAIRAVTGCAHLYLREDAPAMIAVVRDAFFGWVVSEIKGPKNNSVSPAEAFEIKRAFNNAGILSATSVDFEWASEAFWDGLLGDADGDDDNDDEPDQDARSEREVEEFFGESPSIDDI